MMPVYLAYFFSGLAVILALSTILQKNPVYSAASLIGVMIMLACDYVLLGADFIAAIQIIVYVGAIMVLFVFVIMLLNIEQAKREKLFIPRRVVGVLLGLAIFLKLSIVGYTVKVMLGKGYLKIPEGADSTTAIGKYLFSNYLLPFEVASIVLLVGLIGAVVLGRREAK